MPKTRSNRATAAATSSSSSSSAAAASMRTARSETTTISDINNASALLAEINTRRGNVKSDDVNNSNKNSNNEANSNNNSYNNSSNHSINNSNQTENKDEEPIGSSWREVLVHLILGLSAVFSLLLFLNYPSFYVGMVSVGIIGVTKWILVKSLTRQTPIPATDRICLVTSCRNELSTELVVDLIREWPEATIIALYQKNKDGRDQTKDGRHENKDTGRQHVLYADFDSVEEMEATMERVREITGERGLWCLVWAGVRPSYDVIIKDIELTRMTEFEKMTSDLLQTVQVIKSFLPLLRKATGRLITIQTNHRSVHTPFCGLLNVREAALSALTRTLGAELRRFGVMTCVIETFCDVTETRERKLGRRKKPENGSGIRDALSASTSKYNAALFDSSGRDYGDEYLDYMSQRTLVDASQSARGRDQLLSVLSEAVWGVTLRPVYRLSNNSTTAIFVQRYPFLSHLLPHWFVDQLLMFAYKNSPLPLAAPEPVDDD